MSAQLDQILGYLDREGVTELVLAAGQPMQFRRSGALVSITAAQLTRTQVVSLVAGTALAPLLGQRGTAEVEHGKRRLRLESTGTAEAPALKISKAPAPAKPVPASPGAITERARRPSRAGRATASPRPATARTKTPGRAASPRSRGASRAPATAATPPAPTPMPDTYTPSTEPVSPAKTPSRLTMSDIKFKTPGRGRPSNAMPLDLDPETGTAPELDPPTLDLAARAAAAKAAHAQPAGLSLELDDPDDGIELGAPGGHRGGSPAIDAAFRTPHVGSTPAIDAAFGGPALDRHAGPHADPHADPSELDAAFARAGLALDDLGPRIATPRHHAREAPTDHRPQVAPIALDDLGPRVSIAAPGKPAPSPPAAVQPLGAAFAAAAVPMPTGAPTLPPALRELVQEAARRGASDLHLAPGRPPCARLLGQLLPLRDAVLSPGALETLVLPLLDARGRAQLERIGYADFAFELPGGGRLRTNISRCQGGVRGTFRIAREQPPTLDELGLPKELAKVIGHHQGLVVIAGPSGHGKTTTLAALVDLVNSTSAFHIITVEDPIEIVYPRKTAVVSQREVGPHTASFAAALKGSLREDPDVIVIGELRDRETVEIALTAAETGHLVLATMSTPSATKTIDRLVDMFPPDDQSQVRASIAGALRAIVAQRLLPTARGDGVVAAIELLTGVLPLANMIRDDKLFQLPSLMQRGRAFGMIRLDDSLAELVRAGRITSEVALAAAESRKELATRLSQGTAALPVTPGRKP